MKKVLFLLVVCLLISINESNRRHRRHNDQYGYIPLYGNQFGLYGPGGQGWVNNYNNRYPNPNYVWNNNFNWNHGNRLPEWYYNSGKTIQPSILCVLIFSLRFLCI
ncbi:unnamed protein product [Rotaria socialis]|uniref:Uncharacterized protein n=1 Tax=Rotaria socialis TaxID=392032 RepID=A0A820N4I3_9BILA|nr:unnamed protein product [Rotaria socialis]CAF3521884.1 unnamed protein product [Rotaria socialis]CAF4382533.1 unnamed protein product [Rotaria socialis]CAF4561546.1 unnamed protein product [Rotaria socialis]